MYFFFTELGEPSVQHSFPTRRSSDLHVLCEKPLGMDVADVLKLIAVRDRTGVVMGEAFMVQTHPQWLKTIEIDRKSTRLNSSHVENSYAVFCLKNKILIIDHESTIIT